MQKGAEAMHRFDYSFLDNGMLPAGLLNITTDIYSLRAMSWNRKDQFADVFTELAAIAKVQSVKSSNAIEGIVTTDERINAIVNANSAPLNHSEQEIAGYRDALAAVHTEYADMDFFQSGCCDKGTSKRHVHSGRNRRRIQDRRNDILRSDLFYDI